MLVAQEGVAPHRVCQEAAAAVAVAGPGCLLFALPCTASPILDGCIPGRSEIDDCVGVVGSEQMDEQRALLPGRQRPGF